MKQREPARRYLWVMAVACLLLLGVVIGNLRRRTSVRPPKGEAVQEIPTAVPRTGEREALRVVSPEDEQMTAAVENLPLPEDAALLERWYAPEGLRKWSDAQKVWQKGADRYIDFLKDEAFEEGVYRTYMTSELLDVMANEANCEAHYHRIVMILARTRRFSKLMAHVEAAKTAGDLDEVLATLDATVHRFLSERKMVEEAILQLVEDKPEIFRPGAPEKDRYPMIDLFQGFATFPYDLPEGIIPVNLEGTELGVVANSFLLGLTEDPRALVPLLEIAHYDCEAFVDKVCEAFGSDSLRETYYLANMRVVGDACDRILMASGSRVPLPQQARGIASEYAQWRAARALPERKAVPVFFYDAPRTAWHLPGALADYDPDTNTFPLELPIPRKVKDVPGLKDKPGLSDEDITTIMDYAERFDRALAGILLPVFRIDVLVR